jgi:hypothetical protein
MPVGGLRHTLCLEWLQHKNNKKPVLEISRKIQQQFIKDF